MSKSIKAFTLSALLSLLLTSTWSLALMYAIRHNYQSLAAILFGGYGVAVLVAALISTVLFKEQKWQAACGALAISLAFVGVVVAGVALHHHSTTTFQ